MNGQDGACSFYIFFGKTLFYSLSMASSRMHLSVVDVEGCDQLSWTSQEDSENFS